MDAVPWGPAKEFVRCGRVVWIPYNQRVRPHPLQVQHGRVVPNFENGLPEFTTRKRIKKRMFGTPNLNGAVKRIKRTTVLFADSGDPTAIRRLN